MKTITQTVETLTEFNSKELLSRINNVSNQNIMIYYFFGYDYDLAQGTCLMNDVIRHYLHDIDGEVIVKYPEGAKMQIFKVVITS